MSRENLEKMLAGICIVMTCEDALKADVKLDNRDTVSVALEAASDMLFGIYSDLVDAEPEEDKKHD